MVTNKVSTTRLGWAVALTVIAIPTLFIGLADPLEGLIPLVIGIVCALIARANSKVRFTKLALSSFWLAFILIAVILGFAIAAQVPSVVTAFPTADNAIAGVVLVLMWVQRAVLVLMVIGLALYIGRLVRARRVVADSSRLAAKSAAKSAPTSSAKPAT